MKRADEFRPLEPQRHFDAGHDAERILSLSPLTLDRLGDIRQFLRITLAELGCAGATPRA